jgi:hypothetical protein
VPGQVVDTQTAEEFMGEVAARMSEHDLAGIDEACRAKSERFGELLGDGRSADLAPADLRRVLRSVFSTRRRAGDMLRAVGDGPLTVEIDRLLHGPEALPARFERFDTVVAGFPDPGFDLPGELLHFTYPDRYWPWARWMWDPRVETGALPLVTMEDFELAADGRGASYLRVGEAVAFVQETGRAAGFAAFGPSPFGIDVFLACVYGVYLYTVLRMRMTQEFNQIVPELPDLVRRLLGVHRPEV